MKIELTEDQIDGVVYDALMTLEENNPTDGRVLQALKPNRRKLHKAIKRVLSVQFSYETGLLADRQYENEPYENESRKVKIIDMKIELTEDQIDGVVYDALMTLEENNPIDRKLHKAIKRVLRNKLCLEAKRCDETGLLADRQYENDHRVDHRVVAKTTKTTKGDK